MAISEVINEVGHVVKGYYDGKTMYKLKSGAWVDHFDISDSASYARETVSTYKTYRMSGVTGIAEDGLLSIAQLVMALTLQRATEVENETIEPLMEELAANTTAINAITMFTEKLAPLADGITSVTAHFQGIGFTQEELDEFNELCLQAWPDQFSYVYLTSNVYDHFLIPLFGFSTSYTAKGTMGQAEVDLALDTLNSELDSLNSISQELLIELQSETTKRDQAYDLLSAINKSLNTVMLSTANNM